jgi:hypothetical protein
MVNLNTQTVLANFGAVGAPFQNGSSYSVQIPQSSVVLSKPLSYEFRVVEHMENGYIVKVGLQYQVWEHDNYGVGIVKQTWTDVPRVQKDVATGAITGI